MTKRFTLHIALLNSTAQHSTAPLVWMDDVSIADRQQEPSQQQQAAMNCFIRGLLHLVGDADAVAKRCRC
ncbi:unnamed protein product [Ceratitis capitata]|uniref:(Mediterranean fruit fly) hypothetical protein n=1 Tax=Ceratitis capitata TaxID=7213 RepID=A0A811VM25_CERCA|nr:unnamed protein product [Ceratitis capitata]